MPGVVIVTTRVSEHDRSRARSRLAATRPQSDRLRARFIDMWDGKGPRRGLFHPTSCFGVVL